LVEQPKRTPFVIRTHQTVYEVWRCTECGHLAASDVPKPPHCIRRPMENNHCQGVYRLGVLEEKRA